jgi:DNA primase
MIASTAMNGANAPVAKTDWGPLKDKHVLVWPDNDEAGLEYARKASEAIANAGASSVAVLHIPDGKPDKWDAYDAIPADKTRAMVWKASARERVRLLPCALTMTTENHFYRPLERHQWKTR